MVAVDRDLLAQLEKSPSAILSGADSLAAPPWCDKLVKDELQVAIFLRLQEGFSCTPISGLQDKVATQATYFPRGACFMLSLDRQTA